MGSWRPEAVDRLPMPPRAFRRARLGWEVQVQKCEWARHTGLLTERELLELLLLDRFVRSVR